MWWRRRTQTAARNWVTTDYPDHEANDCSDFTGTRERSFVSRDSADRRKRRRLERKVNKLLRQAPERQPDESVEEYAQRMRPWILNRVNEATDAGDLWSMLLYSITEQDAETVSTESEPWIDLARRYGRREGGTVHITHPAIELFERYGYDPSVAIVKHFKQGGAEKGVRSYFRVGESLGYERVAVEYVAERDAVVIWRWGEADHDPDLSILEEHDIDA